MNKPNQDRHTARPSFFSRVSLAFSAFFRIVGNPDYAGRIDNLPEGNDMPAKATDAAPAARCGLNDFSA